MRKLANRIFNNQLLCKQWIRSELLRIGELSTQSVTQSDKELLFQIIQGHPDKQKIENVKDFVVQIDNTNPLLFIMKDQTWESISWVACSTGRPPTEHGMRVITLRKLIAPQIIEFRNQAEKKCTLCESTERLEVDHIYLFSKLMKDYTGNSDNEWIEYHKEHAKLRILCRSCNQAYKG